MVTVLFCLMRLFLNKSWILFCNKAWTTKNAKRTEMHVTVQCTKSLLYFFNLVWYLCPSLWDTVIFCPVQAFIVNMSVFSAQTTSRQTVLYVCVCVCVCVFRWPVWGNYWFLLWSKAEWSAVASTRKSWCSSVAQRDTYPQMQRNIEQQPYHEKPPQDLREACMLLDVHSGIRRQTVLLIWRILVQPLTTFLWLVIHSDVQFKQFV